MSTLWHLNNGQRVKHVRLQHLGTVVFDKSHPQDDWTAFILFDGHSKPIKVGKPVLAVVQ